MNYPNNIKKTIKNPLSHKNRGMDLEDELNLTNEYYLETNKALIYKKPTPIGVAKVSYSKEGKVIDRAFLKNLLLWITMAYIEENILNLKQKSLN